MQEHKNDQPQFEKAVFAGGCFWCMEHPFDELNGVISTTTGYTGGTTRNPSYEEVSSGRTGHAEAVQVIYDPSKISYADLLDAFWHNIDPTARDRQFSDVGNQYRTAVFYYSDTQKRLAEASKKKIEQSGRFQKPIVTDIIPASDFYRAEDYHQDFYQKSPVRYKMYRMGSGRDRYLKKIWGKPAG